MSKTKYPERRDLCGIYFRVRRDGKWQNICWTDLTDEEREEMSEQRTLRWWKGMVEHLTATVRRIGDEFNIKATYEEDE